MSISPTLLIGYGTRYVEKVVRNFLGLRWRTAGALVVFLLSSSMKKSSAARRAARDVNVMRHACHVISITVIIIIRLVVPTTTISSSSSGGGGGGGGRFESQRAG